MNIKAVLFDLDGTLTRYNLNYFLARKKISEEFNNLKIGVFKTHPGMNINSMIHNAEGKIPDNDFTLLLDRIYNILLEYELEFAKKVEILPNVKQTLQTLKNDGLKIAIVTNNGSTPAQKAIDRNQLNKLIDVLITREDAYRCKPNGAMVKKALDKLKVTSDESVFVGDSVVDILAARNSSVVSVAIPSGPTKSIDLMNNYPNYIIQSISEIPSLINLISIDNS